MRGDGCIFKRGKVYWIKYYRDGQPYAMSAETTVKEVAKDRLREEISKARSGKWLDPKARAVTVGELVDDLLVWYRTHANRQRMATSVEGMWNNHLKTSFEHVRAESFGTEHQRKYRARRAEEKAAPATINRELQSIRKAFKLAHRAEPPKVLRVPYFDMAPLDNARKVFFDQETMNKLRRAASSLGLWQRIAVEVPFTYGWRIGEVFSLRVRDVDLAQRLLRLETSKNKQPREVPLTDDLCVLLQAYITGKQPDELLAPYSIGQFRFDWAAMCEKAGIKAGKKGGYILHDARRTSARNKSAAGVSSRVIMQLQGWTSEAMFKRYAIVDQTDMRRALELEKQHNDKSN